MGNSESTSPVHVARVIAIEDIAAPVDVPGAIDSQPAITMSIREIVAERTFRDLGQIRQRLPRER